MKKVFNLEAIKAAFAANSNEAIFQTSDGFCFTDRNYANGHSTRLEDKEIAEVTREEFEAMEAEAKAKAEADAKAASEAEAKAKAEADAKAASEAEAKAKAEADAKAASEAEAKAEAKTKKGSK